MDRPALVFDFLISFAELAGTFPILAQSLAEPQRRRTGHRWRMVGGSSNILHSTRVWRTHTTPSFWRRKLSLCRSLQMKFEGQTAITMYTLACIFVSRSESCFLYTIAQTQDRSQNFFFFFSEGVTDDGKGGLLLEGTISLAYALPGGFEPPKETTPLWLHLCTNISFYIWADVGTKYAIGKRFRALQAS